MTSYFVEKSKWVAFDDISVIVDNSVEIGDFSAFSPIFAKLKVVGLKLKFAGGMFQK